MNIYSLAQLALLGAASLCVGSPAVSQSREPPPGGTVSSTNQHGGITAYWIGQVTYEQVSAPDPQDRQFAGILEAHQTNSMGMTNVISQAPVYTFLITANEPDSAAPRSSGVRPSRSGAADELYMLFVDDDADGDDSYLCEAGDDGYVTGVALRMPSRLGETTSSTRLLTRADLPLVQRICDGLGLPLSSIERGRALARDGSDTLTIFDFLSRGSGRLIILLYPARIAGQEAETFFARYYWSAAFTLRYNRIPTREDLLSDPTTFRALSNAESGEPISLSLPLSLPDGEGLDAYVREARQEFGDRIGRLDAQWLAYLVRSGLTVQGRQRPLMTGSRTTRILPRFSRPEIGTPEFWRAASEITLANQMINCIAGRFLDDGGYRTRPNPDETGRCVRQQTVLPVRGNQNW
jgi:hypothetical protein